MSVCTISDVLKNSMVRSLALLLCTALVASACSGGGGGGGSKTGSKTQTGLSPIPKTDDNPNSIFPGPGQPALKVLRTGDGSTHGFINVAGDVDYFRMELVGGILYGLQVFNFPEEFRNFPVDSEIEYSLLVSDGAEPAVWTGGFDYPAGVFPGEGNIFFGWLTPYTGTYYLRVQSQFLAGVSEYEFRVTSSQLGVGIPRESRVYNKRSYHELYDGEENLIYIGPTPFDRTEEESVSSLEGFIRQPEVIVALGSGGAPITQVEVGWSVPAPIFFLDPEGNVKDTPETPVAHLHWGTPSEDLADGEDDIFWNFDPTNPFFNIGPNFNAFPDLKFDTDGVDFIVELGNDLSNAIVLAAIPEDVLHLMLGNFWYVDAHFHDQFDLHSHGGFPGGEMPLVSSRPQGGVNMYDSRFLLNGFETVPATGAAESLEVYYSDEQQVFYLQYGYDSSLAGNRIHVHSGAPGEVGDELIDLGTVPFPTARPIYEPEWLSGPTGPGGSYRFYPGVENIIKRLTNDEAKALKLATFTTGWYLDVHTSPFFIELPLIRDDAILHDNWEVAASRIISFIVKDSEEETGAGLTRSDVELTEEISFISDDLEFGPIVVYLDGVTVGQLDLAVDTDKLVCGTDLPGEALAVLAKPGTYRYHGSSDNGMYWEGDITVSSGGGCTMVVLSPADAKTEE